MRFILFFLLAGIVSKASAQGLDAWGSDNEGVRAMWDAIRSALFTRSDPVAGLSNATIAFVFPLIGATAVLLVIYAGIRMMTAQGKEDQITKARQIILYALLGVILALLSSTVVLYLINSLLPALLG